MALGATRRAVFREVILWGLGLAFIGIGVGEVMTAGLTGVAGALAQGVAPAGVWVHVLAAAAWLGVALVACYRPAARASRVDPMTALRCE